MSEFLKILAALLLLYAQYHVPHSPLKALPRFYTPTPVTAPPTATATPSATPPPTAAPVPSNTATVKPTPTATKTLLPTATATATARPTATSGTSSSDPTGFQVTGVPPAQTLPAAVLLFPLVRSSGTQDTRIEILNLTGFGESANCFYVSGGTCNEVGFSVRLTPYQPISWMASSGMSGNGVRLAPPFNGDGELKCAVAPTGFADTSVYNALQGRALVLDSSGQTTGYSAIAFRRLSAGSFTGSISLDGSTYEQCPDRLHFHVLSNQTGSDSMLVLVPCSEDLVTQQPSGANVQLGVVNELEQRFSGSTTVTCFNRLNFSSLFALRRATVGTDTAHLIVRGTNGPVVGLVVDRFTTAGGALSVSSNEPSLEGGRSAVISLP